MIRGNWSRRHRRSTIIAVTATLGAAALVAGIAAVALIPQPAPADTSTGPAPSVATYPWESRGPDRRTETLPQMLASDDDLTIVVAGDATSLGAGNWVEVYAEQIAATRSVSIAEWNNSTGEYGAARQLSSAGPAVNILNASTPGLPPANTRAQIKSMIPEHVYPDAIVVNQGQSAGPDIVLDVSRLTSYLENRYPTTKFVGIVQPTRLDGDPAVNDERASAIRDWITEAHPDWTIIDANAAFQASPDPATLYRDSRRPNDLGASTWAQAMLATDS